MAQRHSIAAPNPKLWDSIPRGCSELFFPRLWRDENIILCPLIVTMRIWRSINITLIRDLPLLTFLLPSYSSSSMSSSMSNMFIRHRTSVALLCRLADRSRPGICIWAGIMFIASGWRIKKGKKKKIGPFDSKCLHWFSWLIHLSVDQLVLHSYSISLLTLFMLVLAPTLALWTINFFSPSCIPLSPVIACIERNSSWILNVQQNSSESTKLGTVIISLPYPKYQSM